jgi:hypothetical protein
MNKFKRKKNILSDEVPFYVFIRYFNDMMSEQYSGLDFSLV